jgi:toxin ParE1/3/4
MMLRIRLTLPARRDIADLLDWSAEHFGPAGRRRYEALLETALRDIAADPARTGSREETQLGPGLRIYHLRLSRDRAKAKFGIVRSPRHILLYRSQPKENVVSVLRVLHDAMDLVRHFRTESSTPDEKDQ